ncbi:MAG: hypothetical protein C4320_02895 [Armatimonadota bacterium]
MRIVALLSLVLLTGCHANSIEGKWKLAAPQPGISDIVFTFQGGKLDLATEFVQPGTGSIKVKGEGTYKVEGENLTGTVSTINLDTSGASPQAQMFLNNPAAKGTIEGPIKTALTKGVNGTIKFDSSDRILLTSGGESSTLVRVK